MLFLCVGFIRLTLMKPWQQILLAMVLALVAGSCLNAYATDGVTGELMPWATRLVAVFDFVGTLFMQLLKMVIVPLVFSSIITGIAGLGKVEGFARLGGKTLLYYAATSLIAILIGLCLVNMLQPGLVDGEPNAAIKEQIENNEETYAGNVVKKVEGDSGKGGAIWGIFLRMVPENIFQAFGSNGQMLALIFVAILTAIGLIKISDEGRKAVLGFMSGVNELSMLIIQWVMMLAPIGVFALVAETASATGIEIIKVLGKYFFVVLAALLTHLFVSMPILLAVVGKVNPLRHYKAMLNPLMTAFSTASSSATLPVTMRALREKAGVSNRVSGTVLPLGATVNMDGTALYECVAVMFVAQVLGLELGFLEQFSVVTLALLTSIGVAGVPSASLVAIVIIINNVGIANSEAVIGLLLAVDRPLDMTRTAVNVFSDSCGAIIVAKSEGEDVLQA